MNPTQLLAREEIINNESRYGDLVDDTLAPLTVREVFYLGTIYLSDDRDIRHKFVLANQLF